MTYKAYILGNGPSRPKDVEWFNNLDKGKFEMKYGDQYIIKGISSEYETT